jgi:hypothetical protein
MPPIAKSDASTTISNGFLKSARAKTGAVTSASRMVWKAVSALVDHCHATPSVEANIAHVIFLRSP